MRNWCWMSNTDFQLDSQQSYLHPPVMLPFSEVDRAPLPAKIIVTVLAYNQVPGLSFTWLRILFMLFRKLRWWICDRNETRDQENNGRIHFHCSSECFVPVPARNHETLSTIPGGLILQEKKKTGSLTINIISTSATSERTTHRVAWTFLQLCRYDIMTLQNEWRHEQALQHSW